MYNSRSLRDGNLDDLRKHQVVLPTTADGLSTSNHFLMAEPKSPLFTFALHELQSHNQWLLMPYLYVFSSTGPLFLGQVTGIFLKDHPTYDVLLLGMEGQKKYCYHRAGRSWHQLDGYLLNVMADHPKFIVALLSLISFAMAFHLLNRLKRRGL